MKARLVSLAWMFLHAASFSFAQQGQPDLVTALSSEVTTVDQPVILIFRFVNVPPPDSVPPSIPADGLDVSFRSSNRSGFSAHITFGSGGLQTQADTATEVLYIVTPQRTGTFTIAPYSFDVGGKRMRSKKQTLRVVDAGTQVPRAVPAQPVVPQMPVSPLQQLVDQFFGGGGFPAMPQMPGFQIQIPQPGGVLPQPQSPQGKEYFGEMTLGANKAYVGEAVPVDLRYHFRADMVRDGWKPEEPRLSGEGFTVAPMSQPNETVSDIDGVSYRVYTFRTAIIAAKTGDLDIPPAILGFGVVTPFGQQRDEIRTESRQLRVDPLPAEGRPDSFAGAIGQDLQLSSKVDPESAEPGEPLTYSLTLRGRGNFEAISAPKLNHLDGWRDYQPKESFRREDEAAGFGGSKTFDYKIVARRDQTATPGAEFSYFDPTKKKYFTLTAEPLPVDAKGRTSAAVAPSPGATPETQKPQAGATLPPVEGIAEPAKQLASAAGSTLAPLARNHWFWWINLSLAAVFLVVLPLVAWLRRRAARNALSNELRWALKQARSALTRASDRPEFYNAAAHFVQARLAVGEGQKARFIDTQNALKRQVKDPIFRREIEAVLGRRDEMKYGGRAAGSLDLAEKNRVITLLDKFSDNHE